MRDIRAALLAIPVLAVPAQAEDQVPVGAVPAWVTPLPVPAEATDATRGQALSFRLLDFQTRIDGDGVYAFRRTVMRVTRAEALQAAGTVAIPWQPGTDRVLVHAVRIHRGGETIDVLGRQKFSVIRREGQLERSILDGQLTALLQIADLRVGDSLEVAVTHSRKNPVLNGHGEDGTMFVGEMTADRARIAMSWPSDRPVRWQAGEGLGKPAVAKRGGFTEVVIDRAGFRGIDIPAAAPMRYLAMGEIAATDFASWNDLAATLAPAYVKAATLAPDSPLKAEVAQIAAASADPRVRATAALRLVQSQVRYLADVSGLGGYLPQDADVVWKNRYGDCKGKTALLVALLGELGIEARAALVSTARGDGLDKALPMAGRFDHVIVEARIGGKTYWLDGTRIGDGAIDQVPVPEFAWALPLTAEQAALVALETTPMRDPETETLIDFDASAGVGIPAQAVVTYRVRGDRALQTEAGFSQLSAEARERTVREFWEGRLDFLTGKTASYRYDRETGVAELKVTGTADLDWGLADEGVNKRYEADFALLGMTIAPKRKDGPLKEVPVRVAANYDMVRQTIKLPQGGKGFFLEGETIDETIAGIRYVRTAQVKDGVFEMTTTVRNAAGEIDLAAAEAADKRTEALRDKALFVRMPYDYDFSAAETAALRKAGSKAGAPKDLPDRAAVMAEVAERVESGKLKEALALLDGAIGKAPADALLLQQRAYVHMAMGEPEKADIDVDAALASDSRALGALNLRAMRLSEQGRLDDALIVADRIVLISPDLPWGYQLRAELRGRKGNVEGALADLAIVDRMQPDNVVSRIDRIKLLLSTQRREEALVAATAFVEKFPDNATGHALRANVLAVLRRTDEARAAAAKSIVIEDTADARGLRLSYDLYAGEDGAQALEDVLAVIRLEPTRGLGHDGTRRALRVEGALAKIGAAYAKALAEAEAPLKDAIQGERAGFYAIAGKRELAIADHDAVVAAKPGDGGRLNARCWYRATANFELDRALADCDAAIGKSDRAAYRDSRGLVRLRRGEMQKAIADYDVALEKSPNMPSSLYGRGLARIAAGDREGGMKDITAARSRSLSIDETYARYGLAAPAEK